MQMAAALLPGSPHFPPGARSGLLTVWAQTGEGWERSPTLSIFVDPLKECKLLRVVHNHELLEQPLDDLADGGGAADVQLLDGVEWQIEGCPLVGGGCGVHLLDGIVDGLRPDPSRHRHGPSEFQMHFDEARVGTVFTLRAGGTSR